MPDDDEYITDDELLIEAARIAFRTGIRRNRFMTLAKQCWDQAEAEQQKYVG